MSLPVVYTIDCILDILPIVVVIQVKLDVGVSGVGHKTDAGCVKSHVEEVDNADDKVFC